MAQTFALYAIFVACYADFSLANKQDAQLGSFLLRHFRLSTQQGPSTPAPGMTSFTVKPSNFQGASYTTSNPSGLKPMPIALIPNSNKPTGSSVATSTSYSSNTTKSCIQRSLRDFRPHATDCSKFNVCMFGQLVDLDCPQGSVFHTKTSSCVPQGSAYDLCTSSRQICPPGFSGRAAHPIHCARYFQCDRPAQNEHWEEHLQECFYPQLFNTATLRCEHFSTVDCGARDEPRDPCEYRANGCEGHISCVPCTVRFPSCRGRPDGINPWVGRPGSPDYVVCSDQRVLYHGRCSQTGYGVQIFDEKSGGCITLNHIPY